MSKIWITNLDLLHPPLLLILFTSTWKSCLGLFQIQRNLILHWVNILWDVSLIIARSFNPFLMAMDSYTGSCSPRSLQFLQFMYHFLKSIHNLQITENYIVRRHLKKFKPQGCGVQHSLILNLSTCFTECDWSSCEHDKLIVIGIK